MLNNSIFSFVTVLYLIDLQDMGMKTCLKYCLMFRGIRFLRKYYAIVGNALWKLYSGIMKVRKY